MIVDLLVSQRSCSLKVKTRASDSTYQFIEKPLSVVSRLTLVIAHVADQSLHPLWYKYSGTPNMGSLLNYYSHSHLTMKTAVLMLGVVACCYAQVLPPTVDELDVEKYYGRWYQVCDSMLVYQIWEISLKQFTSTFKMFVETVKV